MDSINAFQFVHTYFSKRLAISIAVASLAWLLLFKATAIDAQVTFSRDWNAGKRSASLIDCAGPMRSVANLCHLLTNELKTMTTCQVKAMYGNRLDDTDPGDVYLAPRSG